MILSQKQLDQLQKDVATGSTVAQVKLGRAYVYGWGVDQDYAKAAELFKIAAAAGSLDATVGLAILYDSGRAVPQDKVLAKKYFDAAITNGNTWAFFVVALKYKKTGTPESVKRALELMHKALDDENGDMEMRMEAAITLAIWYMKGIGGAPDAERQFQYFLKAADLGSPAGCACVAALYWNGIGVKQDYGLGFDYNLKAAQSGDPNAAVSLAEAFEWGQGAPANLVKALEMYKLAAQNGKSTAPILALLVNKIMYPDGHNEIEFLSAMQQCDAIEYSAMEHYKIAGCADQCGDSAGANRHFRKMRSAKKFAEVVATIKMDLHLIEYFRNERMNDYFLALASSAVLTRIEGTSVRIFVPTGPNGYSEMSKSIILQSLDLWLQSMVEQLVVVEANNEQDCDFRFLPVSKKIFFGTAIARTCYSNQSAGVFLASAKRVLIQLPQSDLVSLDDQRNFKHICLHEIGHALGLRGHSIFASDVMFGTQSHLTVLSERDIGAIRALYDPGAERRIEAIVRGEVERNNPFAQSRLGMFYQATWREHEAIPLLEKASDLNVPQAQCLLGLLYWKRLHFKDAASMFEKAAQGGVPQAQLYRNFLIGVGNKTTLENLEALRRAAAYGDKTSLVSLGVLYAFGDDNLPRDAVKAGELFKQAADQGSDVAKILLLVNTTVAGYEKWVRGFKF